MGIVFYCRSCGARFDVGPASAGKQGRCRSCGQETTIPRADELSSMSAMPAMPNEGRSAAVPPPSAAVPSAPVDLGTDPPSIVDWLRAGISQVGLAPLSEDRIPPVPALPSALDDGNDSTPYAMVPSGEPTGDRATIPAGPGPVRRLWRQSLGDLRRLFRWLNEGAYVASIPFLIVLLFGAAVKARPLALFGATFVVLLNLGRLAAGAAALAIAALRDGPDFHKLRKPARRVLEPAATIAVVYLAFTFLPWLADGQADRGGLADRLESGAAGLERDMRGEVDAVLDEARRLESGGSGGPPGRGPEGPARRRRVAARPERPGIGN